MPSTTSVLSFDSSDTSISNTAIIPVGSNGKISLWNNAGSATYNIDLQGYFTAGSTSGSSGGFVSTDPTRVADNVSLPTNTDVDIQVTGGVIPSNATAIFANVKLSLPSGTGPGSIRVGAGGANLSSGVPSAINYADTGYLDNGLAIKLSANGKIRIRNVTSGSTPKVYVDVQGYFSGDSSVGASYTPISPASLGTVTVAAGAEASFQVSGAVGLPAATNLGSAAFTLWVSGWSATGNAIVYNPDDTRPSESNIRFGPDMDAVTGANTTAIVATSNDGQVNVANTSSQSIQVRLSVQGWFSNLPPATPTVTGTTAGGGSVPKVTGSVSDPELDKVTPIVLVNKGTKTILRVPGSPVASGSSFTVTLPALYTGSYDLSVVASDGKAESTASGTTTISVVGEDQGVSRAVAQSDEAAFLAGAVDQGIDEDLAKIAVWNPDIANGIPVKDEWATSYDADPGTLEDLSSESGTDDPPVVPSADDWVPAPDDESSGDVQAQSAESGSCQSNYKLHKGSISYSGVNSAGQKVYTVSMQRRWCGTVYLQGNINSQWTSAMKVTISTVGSLAGWQDVKTDWADHGWFTYQNNSHGGHWYAKRRHLKWCARSIPCVNRYITLDLHAARDGSYARKTKKE